MSVLAWLPLFATLLLAGPQAGRPVPAPRDAAANRRALWEALDLYVKGDFDAAVARALRVGFDPVQAEGWIAAAPRASRDARRRAAAVCALDVASVRPFLLPRLASWARELVAEGEPGPLEAIWLRASIGIAEGFGSWPFLLEDAPVPPQAAAPRGRAQTAPPARPIAHLRYARQRLGDDPYVAMAEVVGAEFVTSPAIVGSAARIRNRAPSGDRLGADEADRAAIDAAGAIPLLRAAAAAAERLTAVPPLSGEAQVRLGYLKLRLGDTDAALASFQRVDERTADRDLRYLGRLYTALALDRLSRVDEAAAMYRAALAIVPGARTAATLLTALLVRAGRLDDAEAMAVEFMEAKTLADDPWRTYFLGDYPHVRGLIARLREMAR
ncbi:MAG: hypothetical protein IT184_05985 [Acidobacteria bacterium]|nr:hypothetical protein [Acidobacteriota bacterium]